MIKIPTVKELVGTRESPGVVFFDRYENDCLWYRVGWYHDNISDSFEFPVHIGETTGAVFKATDKALSFMRWMRKHIAQLELINSERMDWELAQSLKTVEESVTDQELGNE